MDEKEYDSLAPEQKAFADSFENEDAVRGASLDAYRQGELDGIRNILDGVEDPSYEVVKKAVEKQEEIARVDEALQASLAAEQEARRESEARVLQTFEAKTRGIREEMQAGGRLRMDNEANLRRYLEVDIPKLYESLKDEVENREVMEQRMLQKAMDEVTQLQAAVLSEKKAREDTEEAMLRMMEDIIAKMQSEIAQEREEREQAEEMLLNLLHDTLLKLEDCMRPAPDSSRYNSQNGEAPVTPVQ